MLTKETADGEPPSRDNESPAGEPPSRDNDDRAKLIVDILFAAIIAVGLERFYYDFLLKHERFFSLPDWYNSISYDSIPAISNTISFIIVSLWVIGVWRAFYNDYKKNPIIQQTKNEAFAFTFILEISLFSVIFIILNVSFKAYESILWFISSIIFWLSLYIVWHLLVLRRIKEAGLKSARTKRVYLELLFIVVFILIYNFQAIIFPISLYIVLLILVVRIVFLFAS
jgi:hypothetical protein